MAATPLSLGLDPAKGRVGWALYAFEPPHGRWCGTEDIDKPDAGWHDQQIESVFHRLKLSLQRQIPEHHFYVPCVVVEAMFMGPNAGVALGLADVAGRVAQAARHHFPEARIYRLLPAEWRRAAGLDPKCPKQVVMEQALRQGFTIPQFRDAKRKAWGQDAADAGVMAQAGHALFLRPQTSAHQPTPKEPPRRRRPARRKVPTVSPTPA